MDVQRPAYVLGFTVAVSAAFTAAVMGVQTAFQGRIQRNRVLREQRALVTLFDLGDPARLSNEAVGQLVEQRLRRGETVADPETGARYEVIRAYRSARRQQLLALGFPVGGNGLWAPIRGFLALSPDLRRVHGAVFVEHQETPGLGGRIVERAFQEQFRSVSLPESNEPPRLLYVTQTEPTGPDDPRSGRSVDAITGATQTSRRLEAFLNQDIKQFRRALRAARTAGPRARSN